MAEPRDADAGAAIVEAESVPISNGASTSSGVPGASSGSTPLTIGKRALLVRDISNALVSLATACQQLSDSNGTFSLDSAEAHYYYGKALLEQSRIEGGIIEGGPSAEADEDDDSEDEEVAGEEEEEEQETGTTTTEDSAETEVPPTETDKEVGATEEAPTVEDPLPSTSTADLEATSPPDDADDNSEPATLELAWEVLEVAKLAYTRAAESALANTPEMTHLQKRLAGVHMILGEVATESEQYDQAVGDYETALSLLEALDGEKRELSQCIFQLGLAHVYGKQWQKGIECFQKSKGVIEAKIDELSTFLTGDPHNTELNLEVAELRQLLPEIDEKIADTLDAEREETKSKQEAAAEGFGMPAASAATVTNGAGSSSSAPPASNGTTNGEGSAATASATAIPARKANDISHLVRRKQPEPAAEPPSSVETATKRKEPEAVTTEDSPPGKRVCLEVDDKPPQVAEESVPEKMACVEAAENGGAA